MSGLSTAELVGVRAALTAGASPGAALAEVGHGVLGGVARSVRLGRAVADEAQSVSTGDRGADLLVRALGVAERAGVGGSDAVGQSLRAVRDAAALTRLMAVRTAQARGTALLLSTIPAVVWVLLVAFDPAALAFYATPLGAGLGLLAVGLGLAGRWWSSRMVRQAQQAAARADPLCPARPPRDPRRAMAVGAPLLLTLALAGQPLLGVLAAAAAGAALLRPRQRLHAPDTSSGGAAEVVELVAVAVAAGLPTIAALGAVADLAPPAAAAPLATGVRRMQSGVPADAALDGTGLDDLGRLLAVADRWGAPTAEALGDLAEDLRADRRAAAEEATERIQLSLIFPTTLLTLPAFVIGVVPPLLWTALRP